VKVAGLLELVAVWLTLAALVLAGLLVLATELELALADVVATAMTLVLLDALELELEEMGFTLDDTLADFFGNSVRLERQED
jgi:hypothetical protein